MDSMLKVSSPNPRQQVLYKLFENSVAKLDSIFDEIEQTKEMQEPYEKRRKKTKLVFGKASDNQLSIDKPCKIGIEGKIEAVSINKVELYNALASSIILGVKCPQ